MLFDSSGKAALNSLRVGNKFLIKFIRNPRCDLSQRLMAFGLIPGKVFEVVSVAPLGDPIEIKTRGYHLSLRRSELELLELKEF